MEANHLLRRHHHRLAYPGLVQVQEQGQGQARDRGLDWDLDPGSGQAYGSGKFLAWLLERNIQPHIPVAAPNVPFPGQHSPWRCCRTEDYRPTRTGLWLEADRDCAVGLGETYRFAEGGSKLQERDF
jgi:hypothetical protein